MFYNFASYFLLELKKINSCFYKEKRFLTKKKKRRWTSTLFDHDVYIKNVFGCKFVWTINVVT